MRKREVKEDTKEIKEITTTIFEKRLNMSKSRNSPPFKMQELDMVLKILKAGKS